MTEKIRPYMFWYAERRVVSLRQRIDELRSEVEAANAEHEDAKRTKEIIEQELKGYELESALNEALKQTLQVFYIFISLREFSSILTRSLWN